MDAAEQTVNICQSAHCLSSQRVVYSTRSYTLLENGAQWVISEKIRATIPGCLPRRPNSGAEEHTKNQTWKTTATSPSHQYHTRLPLRIHSISLDPRCKSLGMREARQRAEDQQVMRRPRVVYRRLLRKATPISWTRVHHPSIEDLSSMTAHRRYSRLAEIHLKLPWYWVSLLWISTISSDRQSNGPIPNP